MQSSGCTKILSERNQGIRGGRRVRSGSSVAAIWLVIALPSKRYFPHPVDRIKGGAIATIYFDEFTFIQCIHMLFGVISGGIAGVVLLKTGSE